MGAVGVGGLFGAKAMSFWGTKLALGAFSGAVGGLAGAGYSGASLGQGAMWGAATGFAFTGVAISPVGQAIGRGLSNTGFGRFMNSVNNWVGSSYNDFMNQVHGGDILKGTPGTFNNTDEVWHATTKEKAALIAKNGLKAGSYVFDPNEVVTLPDGTQAPLGKMNAAQLQQALTIDAPKGEAILRIPRSSVILSPASNGLKTDGGASQSIIYGLKGTTMAPQGMNVFSNRKVYIDVQLWSPQLGQ